MVIRPVDENGDVLPVLRPLDLARGAAAEAQLARDRLNMLVRDWWENLGWGNQIIELMKDARLTEADGQALSSYLTGYIRETPGVIDVRDVSFALEGRRFSYSCTAECAEGSFIMHYAL